MKKIKSDNNLEVSIINGVLEIEVAGNVVYSAYDCFTNGVWNDASKFSREIRKAIKELMENPTVGIVMDEKVKITAKEEVIIPEAIEITDDVPEGIDIFAKVPTLRGPAVDKFVEKLEEDENKAHKYRYPSGIRKSPK